MGASPQMCWPTLAIVGRTRQTNNQQPLGNTVYCLHSEDSSLLWYKKQDINASTYFSAALLTASRRVCTWQGGHKSSCETYSSWSLQMLGQSSL